MRVYPGDFGIDEDLRERRCPPLRLPLICVRPPELRIAVGRDDRDEDLRSIRNKDFGVFSPVSPGDWLGKGEHRILLGSVKT